MLALLRMIATAIAGRIEQSRHAAARERERRRLDALYGPRPAEAIAPQLGPDGQAEALGRAACGYRGRAEIVLDAHARAMLKLDAAEYAFSRLLGELGGVMGDRPSRWAPERRTYDVGAAGVPAAIAA